MLEEKEVLHTSNFEEKKCDELSNPVSSDRDSGISIVEFSPRCQETHAKIIEAECQLEEQVIASHKELQNAKKKLEELRLLRFEEKSYLQQEIENLHDKFTEEERNASFLEQQLAIFREQKNDYDRRLNEIKKEQNIALQVNMLQEQEIVRLEMKLKQEESERISITKQLDQSRKFIIEKDQLRMKQHGELNSLKEKYCELEETLLVYKTENDVKSKRNRDLEIEIHALKRELLEVTRNLEECKSENQSSNLLLKQQNISITRLKDEITHAQQEIIDLRGLNESLKIRCDNQEKEHRKREIILQQDLDHLAFNESKLTEKCEEIERNFHETRRKNDEQNFEMKNLTEKLRLLQSELNTCEEQRAENVFLLNELNLVIRSHLGASSGRNPNEEVSADELDAHFESLSSKIRSLQADISALSEHLCQSENTNNGLHENVTNLKIELSEEQEKFRLEKRQKELLEEQFQRASATLTAQDRDLSQKCEEINRLQKSLYENQRRIEHLEEELNDSKEKSSNKAIFYEDEKKLLKAKIHELEGECHFLESAKRKSEEKAKSQYEKEINEKNKLSNDLKLQLEQMQKENEEKNKAYLNLKSDLEKLIEDNKTLAQRLIHLESYSDRLSDMLEKQQYENEKLKERLQKERSQKLADKENEIISLLNKTNELTVSLNKYAERNDKLQRNVNEMKEECKAYDTKNKKLKLVNEQLERKLKVLSDSQTESEKKIVTLSHENESLIKRFDEQSKNVEGMFEKVSAVEAEKAVLRETLVHAEKRLRLKESQITDLTMKTDQTVENYHSLKSTFCKVEGDTKIYEEMLVNLNNEKRILEKSIDESDAEKKYLRDQIANLQRLLAQAEDDKEMTLNELARYERENERTLDEERKSHQNAANIKQLQMQVSSLEESLNCEKRRREKLEELYNRRDDQMNHLRSTFGHSLNTITKDTDNIKAILGRSLQKIDRQMQIPNGEVSDSDINTECDQGFRSPIKSRFSNFTKDQNLTENKSTSADCRSTENKYSNVNRHRPENRYSKDIDDQTISKRTRSLEITIENLKNKIDSNPYGDLRTPTKKFQNGVGQDKKVKNLSKRLTR